LSFHRGFVFLVSHSLVFALSVTSVASVVHQQLLRS